MKKYLVIGGFALLIILLLIGLFLVLLNTGVLGSGDNKLNEENKTELIPYQDPDNMVNLKCKVTETLDCSIIIDSTEEQLPGDIAERIVEDLTGKEFNELGEETYQWKCNIEDGKCKKE